MGCGGFLMLGYQKSSAATPHARNALGGALLLQHQSDMVHDLGSHKNVCAPPDERSNVGRRLRGGDWGR